MESEPLVVRNNLLDSTRWKEIAARDGDVVIATWAKTGTTWVQQIIAQLVLGDLAGTSLSQVSPWVEHRYVPLGPMRKVLESQRHTRFMKTHLPATALRITPRTRYIFIGRDGRDVVWSWYNHHRHLNDRFYEIVRNDPGNTAPYMEPPGADMREYFLQWLRNDGYPLWPFWAHVRSWWALRHLPNLMMVHFDDLKRDLAGSVRKIGAFIGMDMTSGDADRLATRCTLSYMRAHADDLLPEQERVMEGGAQTFFNRGEGGAWQEVLRDEDIQAYESRMVEELGPGCTHWLSRPYQASASDLSQQHAQGEGQ